MNQGQLLEAAYRGIHDEILDGVATAGTVNSLTDTAIIGKYPDKKFVNWICFISETTDNASPVYQYSKITANVNSTGVITFGTLTAGTVDAGDAYSIVRATIPINTGEKLANDALRMLGNVWMPPDTSGTTAVSTRNYTLGSALKGADIRNVYLLDSNNYRYDAPNWDILRATSGTALDVLQFKAQPDTSKTIVIEYTAKHAALTAYNSNIMETVPDELVILATIERFLHWKMLPKRRKVDVANWQEAKVLFGEAMSKLKIPKPTRAHKMVPINGFNFR